MTVNIYIEVTGPLLRQEDRKFGYVLELEGNPNTREGFGEIHGTYHKAQLTGILAALDRIQKPCDIRIYSRDAWLMHAIRDYLPVWEKNGFTGSRRQELANLVDWQELATFARYHASLTGKSGRHGYSEWIMREMGV